MTRLVQRQTHTEFLLMLKEGGALWPKMKQPSLIKIHICVTPFYVAYCTFRCSFKEICPLSGAKTQVKYVNPGMFLLHRYRYILL